MRSRRLGMLISIVVVAAGWLTACQPGPNQSAGDKAAKVAAGKTRLAELEAKRSRLAKDSPQYIALVEESLRVLTMETEDVDAAMALYQENQAALVDRLYANIYLATAKSKKAGQMTEVTDQLQWLRQGMAAYDQLRAKWPNNPMVLIWQASTYANFPAEIGAKGEVLDILNRLFDYYANGAETVTDSLADQILVVYQTLYQNYRAKQEVEDITRQAQVAFKRLPSLAGRPAAKELFK